MFKHLTFWFGFQPGSCLTSTPTRWLKSTIEWVDDGRQGVGLCLCWQISHLNLLAKSMAWGEAPAFFNTRTKLRWSGRPKLLCNFLIESWICSTDTSLPAKHSMETSSPGSWMISVSLGTIFGSSSWAKWHRCVWGRTQDNHVSTNFGVYAAV